MIDSDDLRIADRTKPAAAPPELMDEGQCITALPYSFGLLNNKTIFLSGWNNNGLKIKKFEAGSNSDHWTLTQQDRLHYIPPTP